VKRQTARIPSGTLVQREGLGLQSRHAAASQLAMGTIIFDLDGTLVDTATDLIDTLNTILGREGLPPLAYEEARRLVGHGARRMIERGLAIAGTTKATAELDRMFADFIAHYADHIADRSRPFAGVEQALDALAMQGFRFAVCTNKLEWLSVRLLERLGLAHRFAAICGQDSFPVQKPHPDALLGTLRKAGGRRDRAIMVGDSQADIAAARGCGIPVIGVDFGYSEVAMARLGPDRIISQFNMLTDVIAELLDPGANLVSSSTPAPIYRD
jgi:phosphoglycolate phosphatase